MRIIARTYIMAKKKYKQTKAAVYDGSSRDNHGSAVSKKKSGKNRKESKSTKDSISKKKKKRTEKIPVASRSKSFTSKPQLRKKKSLDAKKKKKVPEPMLDSNALPSAKRGKMLAGLTPWFESTSSCERSHKDGHEKNTNFCNVKWQNLSQLRRELYKFHSYCLLRPIEVDARIFMLNSIKDICSELYGHLDPILRNYGSFSVREICTFSSDVDIALFGVVPVDNDDSLNKRNDENFHRHQEDDCIYIDTSESDVELEKRKRMSLSANESTAAEGMLFFLDSNSESHLSGAACEKSRQEVIEITESDQNSVDCSTTLYTESSRSSPKSEVIVISTDSENEGSVSDGGDDDADKMENFVKTSDEQFNRHFRGYESDNIEVSYVEKPALKAPTLSDETRQEVNRVLKKIHQKCRKCQQFLQVTHIRHAKVPIMQTKTAFNFEIDLSIGGEVPFLRFSIRFDSLFFTITFAGHNGSDTSNFAEQYVKRFRSFAPVCVFLKVLLRQADLDKPFTGGENLTQILN